MWFSTTPSSCVSSSIWTIHWTINGSASKFRLRGFAPSYLFQYAFQKDIRSPSCLTFIIFWPKGGHLVYSSTNLLAFWLFFLVFSITLCMQLGLPRPSITSISQCVCTHPIDLMGIHLLRCVHNNKCIRTHDVIHNTFTPIAQNVGFHVGQEQLHEFLSTTFNSSHWRINIMLTKNGIRT
jgi:hypothetical protein